MTCLTNPNTALPAPPGRNAADVRKFPAEAAGFMDEVEPEETGFPAYPLKREDLKEYLDRCLGPA